MEAHCRSFLSLNDINQSLKDNNCSFGNNPNTIDTPQITSLMPLLQKLSTGAERSFQVAAKRTQDLLVAYATEFPLSFNAGNYSTAKSKRNENVPFSFLRLLARRAESATPANTLYLGRRNVFLVDGTIFDMHDSLANQAVSPQPSDQKDEYGFPKMRDVAAISLAAGIVYSMEYVNYSDKGIGAGCPCERFATL
jgi:hypothetical protein